MAGLKGFSKSKPGFTFITIPITKLKAEMLNFFKYLKIILNEGDKTSYRKLIVSTELLLLIFLLTK
jgi:hypothetical protein